MEGDEYHTGDENDEDDKGDENDEDDEDDEADEDILVQGLDSSEAIKRAKSRRPIIEPIGDFRSDKFLFLINC